MRVSISANELQDTDVAFVSMVKNAANKIPFRIVKEDKSDMPFDLSHAFRRATKQEQPKSAIIGVMTAKGVSNDIVNAALSASGIEADKAVKTEHDEFTKYMAPNVADDAANSAFVVSMKHDVGLIVAHSPLLKTAVENIQKAFSGYDWDSTDFGTVMGSGGFCSGIATASDMLDLTIANIMQKAENPTMAAEQVGAAVEAFKTYVTDLTKALPERAFKADTVLAAFGKAEKKTAKPTNAPANWDDLDEDKRATWVKNNPVQKAANLDTSKPKNPPDGWDKMSDEDKHKWNTKAKDKATKTAKLPSERPVFISPERWDAMVKAEAGGSAAMRKAALPAERPAWMTEAQWNVVKADLDNADVDWPQGDLTNGHGGGAELGAGTGTNPSATVDDKTGVPKTLGNDTQTPEGALAVHKATYEGMKKSGTDEAALSAYASFANSDMVTRFAKTAITFDPTKDQSVSGAEMGDGKGFAAAKAPPKGTADEDYEKSIDTKLRAASVGMRKAADASGQRSASAQKSLDMPDSAVGRTDGHRADQKLDDNQSGAGATQSNGNTPTGTMKGDDGGVSQVLASIAGLQKTFDGKFSEFAKSLSGLETRVEKVNERMTKTEAAVNGTALVTDTGGDVIRKRDGRIIGEGDGDGADIPLLDTGFTGRAARMGGRRAA